MNRLVVLAFSAFIALTIIVLPAFSDNSHGDGKNWKRIEWVDEKGVKHISYVSPRAAELPPAAGQEAPARPEQAPLPQIVSAKIEQVVSVDTVIITGGRKLRYVGLRGPLEKETGYSEALAYHKKLVEGKFVNILFDSQQTDPDGTLLGLVFIGQMTFVNAELIRHGHARANPQPPNVKYQILFANLQQRAQSRNLGIWKK